VIGRELGSLLNGLERWLLPGECLLCRCPLAATDGDALVCRLCRIRWRPVPEPVCDRCGAPRELDERCRVCADWPAGLERVRSAVMLEAGARDVVHRLKYEGWWRVCEVMSAAMTRLEPLTARVSLIPIPLAPRRERLRGYNQSERLAAALGAALGLELRADGLRRVRATPTQTALTPDERRANVSGAFVAGRVRGIRAVLVDDVFTTGATLLAAPSAMRASAAADRKSVV